MSIDAASKEKPVGNFLSSLIEAYPDAKMRNIAVLFTDIVGSTRYFKEHGDIRGREMLRMHHTMAISIVEEYGGSLTKEIGDSVLVYFPNPIDALNASIKIQHKFAAHNEESIPEDQIHLRIGLHYGKVIVEDKDIYGDVVNVAAKLTNLAGTDQIFISYEIYGAMQNPSIPCESLDFWNMKDIPHGLKIYKLMWEKASYAPPVEKIMVMMVHDASRPEFRISADNLGLDPGGIGGTGDRYIAVKNLPETDRDLMFVYEDAVAAFRASRSIIAHCLLKRSSDHNVLPVKVLIKEATSRDEMNIMRRGPGKEIDSVPFGGIYISGPVFRQIENIFDGNNDVRFEAIGNFYRVIDQTEHDNEVQEQVGNIDASPAIQRSCFYCGSTRHPCAQCPSKSINETGKSLHYLGYLPIKEIEGLAESIERSAEDLELPSNLFSAGSTLTRHELIGHAFYDLKFLYQLRFNRIIWNTKARSWDNLFTAISENQGGFAWLAQDSLRVANYDKAASFLKLALERNPKDYKAYCVSGFLNIEKDNLEEAFSNFSAALDHAPGIVSRIYISFLIARLHKILGNTKQLKDTVASTLMLDTMCREALYEDICLKFKDGNHKSACQKLARLIRDTREYFVIVLIDPDLIPFKTAIYPYLIELVNDAKKDASAHWDETRREIGKFYALLPAAALETIEPLLAEIENTIHAGSYFGCLDVPHKCSDVKLACKKALNDQIHTITDIADNIEDRFEKAAQFLALYRYPQMARKKRRELAYLRSLLEPVNNIRHFETSDEFENCFNVCQNIADEMTSFEHSLELLDFTAQIIRLCLRFLKHSSILFSIVFFLGIFIFPIFSEQIHALIAKLDISIFPNSWSIQKSLLIFGGILSLFMAFFLSIRETLGGKE